MRSATIRTQPRPAALDVTAGRLAGKAGALSSTAGCTVLGWAYYTSRPGDYALAVLTQGGAATYTGLGLNSSTTLGVYVDATNLDIVRTVVTKQWYFVGFRSSTANKLNGFSRVPGGGLSFVGSRTPASNAADVLQISDDGSGSGNFPGYLAGWKSWTRVLSNAEILAESLQLAPVSRVALASYLPMRSGKSATTDEWLAGNKSGWAVAAGSFKNAPIAPPVPEFIRRRSLFFLSSGGASGAIAGSAAATAAQSAALAGAGALVGTSAATASQSGLLRSTGALLGTSAAVASQSGVLAVLISGSAAAVASQSAALTAAGALAGVAAAVASQSGSLASGAIAGTSAATAGQSGVLSVLIAGTSAASASQSGALVGAGALAGASAATASQTGALAGLAALVGSAAASSSQSGAILGGSSGTASATASQSGALVGAGALAGAGAASASQSGALAVLVSGSAAATSSQSGALFGSGALAAAAAALATASATLLGSGVLLGSAAAAANENGNLAGAGALAGASEAAATASGTLVNSANLLAGTADAATAQIGLLLGAGSLTGTTGATASSSGTATNLSAGGGGGVEPWMATAAHAALATRQRVAVVSSSVAVAIGVGDTRAVDVIVRAQETQAPKSRSLRVVETIALPRRRQAPRRVEATTFGDLAGFAGARHSASLATGLIATVTSIARVVAISDAIARLGVGAEVDHEEIVQPRDEVRLRRVAGRR